MPSFSIKIVAGLCLGLLVVSCTSHSNRPAVEQAIESHSAAGAYGAPISAEGAVPVTQLPSLLEGRDSVEVKVVGTVLESCQAKGCWMQVEIPNQPPMRVTFQDYGFFVPKGLHGQTVVMEGMAHWKTTSVADLQHYAQDAGKSPAEIAAITTPERTLALVAKGVVIEE